ncbi:hypothetical protein L873DRAFT_1828067 [Choiromyces venosus 120613-1]|uniref:Galactose oxidase n=1 Tax=Choiromyces venosus 120613-1 TaxID=1336337 RepID=A0A3N4JQ10_9PEZI|nr:hypothetical protein L873DRAFT_1828067 [Choiromyces venosus 120613-1]
MSVPVPEKPLGNHCSVIFNKTLYTYSATAFQSLHLAKDAEWQALPSGIGTSGAECVHAHRNTPQEALYVVGGTTSDPSSVPEKGFSGVQRWSFLDKRWENIALPTPVAFNLTNHGATYLETSQQLIIFSGTKSPDTSTPSANTYLIGTSAPFEITSIPAADPLLAPLVLPWGGSGALVVGGDPANTNLKTYDINGGWKELGVRLEKGLPARRKAAVSLMDGDDGSRMLLVFDMTTAPTTVTLTKVKEPSGSKRRRQASSSTQTQTSLAPAPSSTSLTQENWPAYNGSFAPKSTRDGFALAYEGDMVVISGGGDAKDPVVVFNARKNTWVNTTELFSGQTFITESTSTASPTVTRLNQPTTQVSSILTPTSTGSTTSTAAASSGGGGGSKPTTIQLLFAILGAVLGAVLILGIALFLLKRRKRQAHRQAGHERRASGAARMSFQDRGASFMPEAGGPLPSPQRGILGRSNSNSWAHIEKQALGASSSTQTLTRVDAGPTVHAVGGIGVISSGQSIPRLPPANKTHHSSRITDRTPSSNYDEGRGSGWSEWFSDTNATTNLVTLPQPTYSTARSSAYTDATTSNYPPLQPGLHINPYLHNAGTGVVAGGGSIGLAATFHSQTNLQRCGSKGLVLEDPGVGVDNDRHHRGLHSDDTSISSRASSFSSGIPDSIHDERMVNSAWIPMGGGGRDEWEYGAGGSRQQQQRETITSSVYPDSLLAGDESRRNTGPDLRSGTSVDNLSWLNLKQN